MRRFQSQSKLCFECFREWRQHSPAQPVQKPNIFSFGAGEAVGSERDSKY